MNKSTHRLEKLSDGEWECARCGVQVARSLVVSANGRKAYSRYVVSADRGATWQRRSPGTCPGVMATTTKKEKK